MFLSRYTADASSPCRRHLRVRPNIPPLRRPIPRGQSSHNSLGAVGSNPVCFSAESNPPISSGLCGRMIRYAGESGNGSTKTMPADDGGTAPAADEADDDGLLDVS
ncbi:hypothetical protein THAOC_25503, partial [Thalassiosira oceanica]